MNQMSGADWAARIGRDLHEDGERVPFDRVLLRHLQATEAVKARGFTWTALARFLSKAGVRRADGEPYSADHLRVSFARLRKDGPQQMKLSEAAVPDAVGPFPPSPKTRSQDELPAKATPSSRRTVRLNGAGSTPKDVSQDEISLAAARLKRLDR